MNYALIFAGGVGQRMNTISLPKQFLKAHGKEIIVHTIQHFQNCKDIDGIVVVCKFEYIELMSSLKNKFNLSKIMDIISGGRNGQESIYRGLEYLKSISSTKDDIVVIHDGVRPIITEDIISQNIICVKNNGSCITVAKANETILVIEDGHVEDAINRSVCFLGRAPQSFYLNDIYRCHLAANKDGLLDFIDSAMLMKHYGFKLFSILGPDNNIKITTPTDYYMFKAMLDQDENCQIKVID